MQRFILLLRVATVAVFLGRAWQHLYWDAPFRAILWDEDWMGGLINALGIDWTTWVTAAEYDRGITWATKISGLLYLLAAIAAALVSKENWKWRWPVRLGGWLLVILAILYTKEKFYHLGQFFEYSLQWGSPFFLLAAIQASPKLSTRFYQFLRLAIALTFVSHGLYAFGYYPRPAHFLRMTMNGLFLDQDSAATLLYWAGILDFIVGLLLLLPWRLGIKLALIYCIFWGFLTTMARVWSASFVSPFDTVLLQWLHQTVYRFPHFILPLALYLLKFRWKEA